jgi:type II secretory pathway component PulJ
MKSPATIRRGMTLVEMLVATTCTLILMGAIAQVFGAFGTAVSDSRSMIELDAQLRSVAWRLRNDLAGATARTLPPLEVEAGEGYFEVIEGPRSDTQDANGNAIPLTNLTADIDDVLLFTTRNTETPYLGKYDYGATKTIESQLAEVAWFLRPTENPTGTIPPVATYTLFRRQNLVIGYVGVAPFLDGANQASWLTYQTWSKFFDLFDLSAQYQKPLGSLVPNSLADLTRRETRFMHNNAGQIDAKAGDFRFPTNWQVQPDPRLSTPTTALDGLTFYGNFDASNSKFVPSIRLGEDVVLANVISFDVRVFDPGAPVLIGAGGDLAIVPGDSGMPPPNLPPYLAAGRGAYVDLGWLRRRGGDQLFPPVDVLPANDLEPNFSPHFANLGEPLSGLEAASATPRVWDTWSTHYESNGFDDDNDGVTDEGADGLDNDSDGKVDESPYDVDGDGVFTGAGDDPGELETLPPYRFPLRGIEVRLRCYEPSSRQVRQVTIRHSFVPR